jgi:hypothetical protein
VYRYAGAQTQTPLYCCCPVELPHHICQASLRVWHHYTCPAVIGRATLRVYKQPCYFLRELPHLTTCSLAWLCGITMQCLRVRTLTPDTCGLCRLVAGITGAQRPYDSGLEPCARVYKYKHACCVPPPPDAASENHQVPHPRRQTADVCRAAKRQSTTQRRSGKKRSRRQRTGNNLIVKAYLNL